ncbi:MAG TPA: response regulator, partial [Polyangiaceae bacterium]
EGEYVLLTVRDNGCGMGKDVLAHLFEPFFTTKGVGKGTGLGLATVYGIVRQNNGFIDVDSEVGQGTSFLVYLPRHTGPCEAPAPDARGPLARGHEVVLLVEDEQAMLVLTTRMLERLGYAVIAAGSPFEAIRLAAQHEGRIDLLVTDVVMPEMNGRELTDSLMQSFPTMKSLYMSGYTADVIAQHGVLDAVRHFIQKPFSLRDLADAVRIALAESPGQAVRVAPIE